MCESDDGNVLGLRGAFQTPHGIPAVNNGHRRRATVTLSRNYIHRSMARRTRIEYSATHMMSEAQPRLSSTACSLMVNSPWRSNAMGPRALAQSACHQTDGLVLGTNLNSSESTRRFWSKKRQLFTEGGL